MPNLLLGTGGFYYWNTCLSSKIRMATDAGADGVEISCVPPGYEFSAMEIGLLGNLACNTLHLSGLGVMDIAFARYCLNSVPNLFHCVLHPNNIDTELIPDDLMPFIAFENMDIRKDSHRSSESMHDLMKSCERSSFVLDINHAMENGDDLYNFLSIPKRKAIHFSSVNRNFYTDFPHILTTHALAYLDDSFLESAGDLSFLKNENIIVIEGVIPESRMDMLREEIIFLRKLIKE